MSNPDYLLSCTCGTVQLRVSGEPRVRGTCHCTDCRALLKIPFHEVTAWNPEQVEVEKGEDALQWYQHPSLRMQRVFCPECGDTVFNTNAMDWRVISQQFIRQALGGELPEELRSIRHFFYRQRLMAIDDELPKQD